MEKIGNYIFFESETEFENFCVAPYAVVKQNTYVGQYSEEYKECIKNGIKFAINDRNCKAVKDHWVTKRVKINNAARKDVLAQLKVQNVEYASPMTRKLAEKQELDNNSNKSHVH